MNRSLTVKHIIQDRLKARTAKDWITSDRLRDKLDAMGVYVFDGSNGKQNAMELDDAYFQHMEKAATMYDIQFDSRRKYVEFRLKQDLTAEKRFEAWLYTMQQSPTFIKII